MRAARTHGVVHQAVDDGRRQRGVDGHLGVRALQGAEPRRPSRASQQARLGWPRPTTRASRRRCAGRSAAVDPDELEELAGHRPQVLADGQHHRRLVACGGAAGPRGSAADQRGQRLLQRLHGPAELIHQVSHDGVDLFGRKRSHGGRIHDRLPGCVAGEGPRPSVGSSIRA